MKPIKNKLRVVHFPQVGTCKKSFIVEVKNEEEAFKIMDVLATQHLWLLENNLINDYSNAIFVEMFDETIDTVTNNPFGWCDYYNEEEEMEWDELENKYFRY